jgi:hypothetical protein
MLYYTHGLVVADRFDKDHLDVVLLFLLERRRDVLAAFPGAVGRVEGGHPYPVLGHVLHQIGEGRVTGDLALRDPVGVLGVVEGGRLLGPAELAAVVPDVENLGGNVVEKRKEPADPLGDVGLSGRRQSDHDDDQLVGGRGSHDLEGGGIVSLGQDVRQRVVFGRPRVPERVAVVRWDAVLLLLLRLIGHGCNMLYCIVLYCILWMYGRIVCWSGVVWGSVVCIAVLLYLDYSRRQMITIRADWQSECLGQRFVNEST